MFPFLVLGHVDILAIKTQFHLSLEISVKCNESNIYYSLLVLCLTLCIFYGNCLVGFLHYKGRFKHTDTIPICFDAFNMFYKHTGQLNNHNCLLREDKR